MPKINKSNLELCKLSREIELEDKRHDSELDIAKRIEQEPGL
jgi:hypothetical protein